MTAPVVDELETESGTSLTTFRAELERQCGRIVVPGSLLGAVAWLGYPYIDRQLYPQLTEIPWIRYAYSALCLLVIALQLRRLVSPLVLTTIVVAALYVTGAWIAGLTGGAPEYVGGYLIVLMVVPAMPLPRPRALGIIALSLAAFAAGGSSGLSVLSPAGQYLLMNVAAAVFVACAFVFLFDALRHRSWRKSLLIDRQRRRLAEDNAKIDALLLNILPAEVAEELKAHDAVAPRLHPSVTVGFTDFVGFTTIAEQAPPEALVAELGECFSAFDALMDEHGLEKLKTIGDGYMFAGGVPKSKATHAVDAVLAALGIVRFMEARRAEREARGLEAWSVRVGLHSGPLTAGVVGRRKFAYDVWGDTVNTASRMESSGSPGEVNVSRATADLVGRFFVLEPRGRLPAKNKGLVEMFFVRGLHPDLSVDGRGVEPNEAFRELYDELREGEVATSEGLKPLRRGA